MNDPIDLLADADLSRLLMRGRIEEARIALASAMCGDVDDVTAALLRRVEKVLNDAAVLGSTCSKSRDTVQLDNWESTSTG